MKNEIKSMEVVIRFMTYLANKPVREILGTFYKFFGKENVDCSIFYPNYKYYIRDLFKYGILSRISRMDVVNTDSVYSLFRRNNVEYTNNMEVYVAFNRLWRVNKNDAMTLLKYIVITCHNQDIDGYISEIEEKASGDPLYFNEPLIYVYFKKATIVLNENDRIKHEIFDYFFCVPCLYGFIACASFSYRHNQTSIAGARTTFTVPEWNYNYVHSHRPSFDSRCPMRFKSHCTGNSNTPLNQLIASIYSAMIRPNVHSLPSQYADLFCINLRTYLSVESNAGGQYRKIEELASMSEQPVYHPKYINCGIGSMTASRLYDLLEIVNMQNRYKSIDQLIQEMLKKNAMYKILKFQGVKNKIVYGMSYNDVAFAISDLITLIGIDKHDNNWFVRAAINNRSEIVRLQNGVRLPNVSTYSNQYILFRGRKFGLKIINSTEESGICVLRPEIFEYLYKKILEYVNWYLDERCKQQQQQQ